MRRHDATTGTVEHPIDHTLAWRWKGLIHGNLTVRAQRRELPSNPWRDGRVLGKALEHCHEHGEDPDKLLEVRLFQDMLPFKFQVWNAVHQSLGAIRGIKEGLFGSPPQIPDSMDYIGMQAAVASALSELACLDAGEVEPFSGKDVRYQAGNITLPFTAGSFVASFSLPNFHFHAAITYGILRQRGIPLGKQHFLGGMRPRTLLRKDTISSPAQNAAPALAAVWTP